MNPEYIRESFRLNEERLRLGRRAWGHVKVRLHPQIRIPVEGDTSPLWVGYRGHAILVNVDEPVDLEDLMLDLRKFLTAWRPMRRRADGAREAAEASLKRWVELGSAVK